MSDNPVEKLRKAECCQSLLKKHLTPDVYTKLKALKTAKGGTIDHCIKSGCENLGSAVGIYASDPEAYDVFGDVLDPVIKEYHKVDDVHHPAPDFGGDDADLGDLDPDGQFVISTRVRVGRSHSGYGFPPVCNKEDRLAMQEVCKEAFKTFDGTDLEGTYYPLDGMSKEVNEKLIKDHFMFKNDDKCLMSADGYMDWPTGRGIFHNKNKTFLVWVNEEDHLRIISMQQGGNLGEVWKRLVSAIKALEKKITFAHHKNLGYLTFCPTNLGTTLRASVHIKIPKLSAEKDFKSFVEKLNLQPRGIHGEHTESEGGVYDISNKRRLGLTEIAALMEMKHGVTEIIKREKELQAASKE